MNDTGARHKGQNGYCTHIGNESFSWFESTNSKSRINFLKLLRAGHSDYFLNSVKDQVWLLYEGLKKYKLNPRAKDKILLEKMFDNIFSSKTASATLNAALKRIGDIRDAHRIITF